MKITRLYAFLIAIMAISMLIALPALAQVSNGDDDSVNQAPVVIENIPATPIDVSNGNDDFVFNTPVSGVQIQNPTSVVVTNGQDDGSFTNPVPPTPPVLPSSSGGSVNIGGGRINILVSATTSCPLINSYMKMGWNNNPTDVANLQIFLRESQKIDLEITGIFDQKTEDAIKLFQRKYMTDVLGPWDATRPSGVVYITTSKKINEIACKQPIKLSAEELAIIASYNQSIQNSSDIIGILDQENASTTEFGKVQDDNSNVAAVENASILKRFWSFVKGLFINLFFVDRDLP